MVFVAVLQRTAEKCTKSYNARAQLLFCSLSLLFIDVPVAVAVVVILNSLMLNKLTLNVKKSNFIIFKSHKRKLKKHLSLKLNNEMLQCVEHTKFLGIIIDQHLTWKNHINYVSKKIIRTTGVLCRIRFYISQPLLRMLYYSLIYPHIHYGNIV